MIENIKNCYIVKNNQTNESIVCHYDEILYFRIRKYDNLIAYNPVLKNNETLLGLTDEEGQKQYDDYINYKNANK